MPAHHRPRNAIATAAALATLGLAGFAVSAASANTIAFSGAGSLGQFKGTLSYTLNTTTDAAGNPIPDLYLTLTNTSPVASGGYLTGVLFNVADPENAAPFGDYEAGAALTKFKKTTDGVFLGPGNPTRGVGVGQTITLAFDVTAPNPAALSSLTARSFLSEPPAGGTGGPPLTARFMGFNDGGSDKTTSLFILTPDLAAPVPLPLAATATLPLLGLLLLRRHRQPHHP
jgi:hypothetical protein